MDDGGEWDMNAAMKTFLREVEIAMQMRFGAFFFLVIVPLWLASIIYVWNS